MPSLKTIAATDIQACDYKKTHRDDNKYNVSHLIAPENRLVCQNSVASAMPAFKPCDDRVFKPLSLGAGCSLQRVHPARRNKIFLSMVLMAPSR
jgi:hypothetical protein